MCYRAQVVMSDYIPSLCSLITDNIAANAAEIRAPAKAERLDWNDFMAENKSAPFIGAVSPPRPSPLTGAGQFDVLLALDCVYRATLESFQVGCVCLFVRLCSSSRPRCGGC